MLWADRANRDLKASKFRKGPGFWKLDRANGKVMQGNLRADFQRIVLEHHQEATKLMEKQNQYIAEFEAELLTVAEPFVSSNIGMAVEAKASILHVLESNDE